jgi:hypothetical protein
MDSALAFPAVLIKRFYKNDIAQEAGDLRQILEGVKKSF